MSYRIIDCWLVFETDEECNSNGILRNVYFNEKAADAEKKQKPWSDIQKARAIEISDSCGTDHRFVLKYEKQASQLGTAIQRRLKTQALSKLTSEEITALRELGVK